MVDVVLMPSDELSRRLDGGMAARHLEQMRGFLAYTAGQFDTGPAAVVLDTQGRPEWFCLPVRNPGRTSMLVLAPQADGLDRTVLAEAVATACRGELSHGQSMTQVLLEPGQAAQAQLLAAAGFRRLAELIYLEADLPGLGDSPTLPAACQAVTFTPDLQPRFAETIQSTYVGTLDCPGLEGVRGIDDVLVSHRSAGRFTPHLWFLFTAAGGQPLGVVLLNETLDGGGRMIELVYMGLVPSARGRGLGGKLFDYSAACAARYGYRRIRIVVDAANTPAMRLYRRRGLVQTQRQIAFIHKKAPNSKLDD